MAHTMIATKAVERMFETDDEFNGLKIAIEHDFMGWYPRARTAMHLPADSTRLQRRSRIKHVVCSRYHGHQI
jgi:hypothetical protein